jgi:pyruvate dehydrogenase E1 component beta subunit
VDDPVVVVEHVGLYGVEGDPTPASSPLAWNRAAVRRPGKDITLVAYGGTVPKTLEAAKELATMGIDAEVVDLRSLRPLDEGTVLESVRKTGGLVVVDEGWKRCSLAAEVMALAAEHALYDLDGPLLRVCSEDVPVPYAKHLEDLVLPQVKRIVDKVQEGVRRHG